MIGRKHSRSVDEQVEPKGFDDFELRLGDVMRGERATLGKSLLDVQRELRIKAAYISAIEDCNPDAFDTPGFIAGYVRSYARYLGMNPDEVFETFCKESGFSVAHGMSAKASVVRKTSGAGIKAGRDLENDIFNRPGSPFVPPRETFLSRIEPGAIGSLLVLVALIGAIGYGGFAVLKEVQRVQVAPVDQTPVVLSDLDPLDGILLADPDSAPEVATEDGLALPGADAMDRLYRPQALDVPVLVARDAPISTLAPGALGNFPQDKQPANLVDEVDTAETVDAAIDRAVATATAELPVPQVVEPPAPSVRMVAVRPSWVRVTAGDGSVILETIMEPGETWEAPLSAETPATLRTGESGAIYFAVNGEMYGPVGETGTVTSNIALSVDALTENFAVADLARDDALATLVAELEPAPSAPVRD